MSFGDRPVEQTPCQSWTKTALYQLANSDAFLLTNK